MGEQRAIRFKQSDVARAVKGLEQAGIRDWTIRIDPLGNIEIVRNQAAAIPKARGGSWDDVGR